MYTDVWAGRWAVDGEGGGGGWRPTCDNSGKKCSNKQAGAGIGGPLLI